MFFEFDYVEAKFKSVWDYPIIQSKQTDLSKTLNTLSVTLALSTVTVAPEMNLLPCTKAVWVSQPPLSQLRS